MQVSVSVSEIRVLIVIVSPEPSINTRDTCELVLGL